MTFSDFIEILSLQNYNTRLVVLSTTALGIAAGLIGAFLLLRKRSLMGDALSHATLPGIALTFGILSSLGYNGKSLPALLTGASLSGILGVLLLLAITRTTRLRDDVAMGLVLSVFFGLGIAILRSVQDFPNAAGLESFLYGRSASIVMSDFLLLTTFAIIISLATVIFFKEFLLLCFDDAYASSQGWPTLLLDGLLLAFVTAVTVVGLQAVGLILIIAFLIIPPTTARFWTNSLPKMLVLSALFGAASGWLGTTLSALLPKLPAGAIIVLVSATLFLASLFLAPASGILPRQLRHHRLRQKVRRQHVLRAAYEILESEALALAASSAPLHITNHPLPIQTLLAKRTWTPQELQRTLRAESRLGHLSLLHQDQFLLSEAGFGEAARVTRNHRLWEAYLITHADIAPNHVDRDADMVEHILEADLVRELEAVLLTNKNDIPHPPSPHEIPN